MREDDGRRADGGDGMGVGVFLPVSHPRGVPPAGMVLEYARTAEALGFDDLWAGDHLLWRTAMLEPTTTLAAAAAVTSRIGIGTNVYLLGLRPALVSANVLGTLSYLAGDRLTLGVGVGGEFPAEFAGVGVPLTDRGRALDRALGELRAWWGWTPTQPATPRVAPAPGRGLPLWVGGRSEPALRRAVRERADAWTAHFVTPRQVAAMALRLAELADDAQLPVPRIAVTLNVNVGDDGGKEARAFVEAHFGLPYERLADHVVTGGVEACAERLTEYAAVCDHLVLFPASFAPREQLERLADVRALVRGVRRDRGGG